MKIDQYTTPIRRLARLYYEDARLTLTEKLTRLLTGIAVSVICVLFIVIALAFISLGVVDSLQEVLDPVWAYLIVGAFYALLICAMIALKRVLFVNPIARFLSKIFLDNPEENNPEKK